MHMHILCMIEYVYMYAYLNMHAWVCIYVYVCMSLYIYACLYAYECMHVLVCAHVYVYDCLYFCMYICRCIYVCICVYMYGFISVKIMHFFFFLNFLNEKFQQCTKVRRSKCTLLLPPVFKSICEIIHIVIFTIFI